MDVITSDLATETTDINFASILGVSANMNTDSKFEETTAATVQIKQNQRLAMTKEITLFSQVFAKLNLLFTMITNQVTSSNELVLAREDLNNILRKTMTLNAKTPRMAM